MNGQREFLGKLFETSLENNYEQLSGPHVKQVTRTHEPKDFCVQRTLTSIVGQTCVDIPLIENPEVSRKNTFGFGKLRRCSISYFNCH